MVGGRWAHAAERPSRSPWPALTDKFGAHQGRRSRMMHANHRLFVILLASLLGGCSDDAPPLPARPSVWPRWSGPVMPSTTAAHAANWSCVRASSATQIVDFDKPPRRWQPTLVARRDGVFRGLILEERITTVGESPPVFWRQLPIVVVVWRDRSGRADPRWGVLVRPVMAMVGRCSMKTTRRGGWALWGDTVGRACCSACKARPNHASSWASMSRRSNWSGDTAGSDGR